MVLKYLLLPILLVFITGLIISLFDRQKKENINSRRNNGNNSPGNAVYKPAIKKENSLNRTLQLLSEDLAGNNIEKNKTYQPQKNPETIVYDVFDRTKSRWVCGKCGNENYAIYDTCQKCGKLFAEKTETKKNDEEVSMTKTKEAKQEGIENFISFNMGIDEKEYQKLKETEAIINFGIAVEKIYNIIYKECPVKHKSVIKFEVAVFIYYKLSSIFDTSIYKFYENVSPILRDHIATIGGYKEYHIDKRLRYYHPSLFSDDDLYIKFSGLALRALMTQVDDWEYGNEWNSFLDFDENDKYVKVYNIMFQQIKNKIEKIIKRTIKMINDPYCEAEYYY
jgi:hypothetical protein